MLVNALLVGRIESDQWVRRHANEGKNQTLTDYYADMGKGLPMGRLGTAQEFANHIRSEVDRFSKLSIRLGDE